MYSWFKQKQPISTTGAIAHSYYWLTSPSKDTVYNNPRAKESSESTAIYFIHGTADFSDAFKRVATRLIKAQLSETISSLHLCAFENRYSGNAIEEFSSQLKDKIKENGHKKVILIGHSRGGLVSAYFSEYVAPKSGIEVVMDIAICAPFCGSYLAIKPLSIFSDSIRQMTIGSEFLDVLNKKIVEEPATKHRFFIAQDDYIVPDDAGFIKAYVDKHPDSLIRLDRHGHLSIMSSHRLVAHIGKMIESCFELEKKKSEQVSITISNVTASHLNLESIVDDYRPKT
jgi:predicted alpha/beta hydrolase family esterase